MLYTVGAMIIILIILWIAQNYYYKNMRSNNSKYSIILKTERGLVSSKKLEAADLLEKVKEELIENEAGISDNCQQLQILIDESIENLNVFIKRNPNIRDSGGLCKFDLKQKIMEQAMLDSVHYDQRHIEDAYQTVLEEEEDYLSATASVENRFEYLLKRIEIVIAMLRNDICDYGKLDVDKLHQILINTQQRICANAARENIIDLYDEQDTTVEKKMPMFIYTEQSIKPFVSNEVKLTPKVNPSDLSHWDKSTLPIIESMSNLDHSYRDNTEYNITDDDSNKVPDLPYTHNYIESKVADHYSKQMGSSLLDKSFEGLAERDILGYRPPGHLIQQLYDKGEHYTTRVNSCLGKTVSDDELWDQCTNQDMKYINALHGYGDHMINLSNTLY